MRPRWARRGCRVEDPEPLAANGRTRMMFTARSPSLFEHDPRWKLLNSPRRSVGPRTGVLPSQALHALIERKEICVADGAIDPAQVQPASLDLRLGPIAYRIRASFLPGKGGTVESKL